MERCVHYHYHRCFVFPDLLLHEGVYVELTSGGDGAESQALGVKCNTWGTERNSVSHS